MSALIGFSLGECTYKKATCKGCKTKLKEGQIVLSVSKAYGSFDSVSSYCTKCADSEINNIMNELCPLMEKAILIREEIDNVKSKEIVAAQQS